MAQSPDARVGAFLRERMELSSVLLLTKAACGPLCQRYARPVGLKAKTAALFTIGPTTQRLPSKKTARMGDVGKAVGCVPPTALLCVRPPFCAGRHFAKNQMRSD
jgi:hypothetical protein